jgi:serine/threonine-protein kinase
MGEVLSAVDELLGREVAVKTLRGRTSGLAARLADERFRLEARAIAQLTHPSVVQVYDLDLAADPPYLVMERVAGPSLKERLAGGPLPEPDVRALGIQIANALVAAHVRGVVHRDVKPANILAAGPGMWKLADFGVAHVPDSSLTMTGQFVGSPAYAPPEALVRGQLGPEGDIFSLGATLYQAAAGTWPRADAETRGLLAPVPPLLTIAPAVPPDLAAAIDRAVSVEPADRPSAAALAAQLAAAAMPPSVAAVALPMAAHPAAASGASIALPLSPSASASAGLAKPPGRSRWKHTVAGLATIFVIILIAATRCSPSAPPGAVTSPGGRSAPGATDDDDRDDRDDRDRREPTHIEANPPPITTQEAARDWWKVVEKLQRYQFGEARRKLAEFETKHGETPETRDLASQLDALPESVRRGGGPGRGPKHKKD